MNKVVYTGDNENRLLEAKIDFVFSELFGKRSHERVLICLLNSILKGDPHIKSVRLYPTDYRKQQQNGKFVCLDLVATSDDGIQFHVEMQFINGGNIENILGFCRSRIGENVFYEVQGYSSTQNIISIWICDEPVTERRGCCHEIVSMYRNNGDDPIEISSEKMRLFVIELSKVEKPQKNFMNDMFSVWMMFIKDPNSIPKEFLSIPEVKEAMDELTFMSADSETRAIYRDRLKEWNDIRL